MDIFYVLVSVWNILMIKTCWCQWIGIPEVRMCSGDTSFNFAHQVHTTRDASNTMECVCHVTRSVPATITFTNTHFTCPESGSWRLEFYDGALGCLEAVYSCALLTGTSTTFEILGSSTIHSVYIKLARIAAHATDAQVNLTVSAFAVDPERPATEIIQTGCGKSSSEIPTERCNASPTGTTTTTSSTSISTATSAPFSVCHSVALQQTSLDGAVSFRASGVFSEICCFQIMDPSSYYIEIYQGTSGSALSGVSQVFTCSILPPTTPDAPVAVEVGNGSSCTVLGVTPRYSLHVATNDSNICGNESSTCQTQVILSTMYRDDMEEIRLHDASRNVYLYDFTRIDLHYQTCGDEVLAFSLPISSNVPLTVTCSSVSDSYPARSFDRECERLYSDSSELPETTSSKRGEVSNSDVIIPVSIAVVAMVALGSVGVSIVAYKRRRNPPARKAPSNEDIVSVSRVRTPSHGNAGVTGIDARLQRNCDSDDTSINEHYDYIVMQAPSKDGYENVNLDYYQQPLPPGAYENWQHPSDGEESGVINSSCDADPPRAGRMDVWVDVRDVTANYTSIETRSDVVVQPAIYTSLTNV